MERYKGVLNPKSFIRVGKLNCKSMRYYVVSSDGQKFGPADLNTLKEWVQQGRIDGSTMLEEEVGSARMAAIGIAGLFPQGATIGPYSAPRPDNQTVYRRSPESLEKAVRVSYVCAALSFLAAIGGLLIWEICVAAVFIAVYGASESKQANDAGLAGGQVGLILNAIALVIALILSALLLVTNVGFM